MLKLFKYFRTSIYVLIILIGVFIIDTYFDLLLYKHGIYPRSIEHLYGIFTHSLLHGSAAHLMNNCISIFILINLLEKNYKTLFFNVLFYLQIISGFWVWVAARQSFHIGASGLIYGLAGFLILSGMIRKNTNLLRISLLALFLNGSIFWGMLPFVKDEISWEGHFFGFLSGILLALFYKNKGPKNDTYTWDYDNDEYLGEPYWEIDNTEESS